MERDDLIDSSWLPMPELDDQRLVFEDVSGRETPGTAPATPDATAKSDAAERPPFDEMTQLVEPPDDEEPEL
jgi:hypothetical protein